MYNCVPNLDQIKGLKELSDRDKFILSAGFKMADGSKYDQVCGLVTYLYGEARNRIIALETVLKNIEDGAAHMDREEADKALRLVAFFRSELS